jgi:hypothetical protein
LRKRDVSGLKEEQIKVESASDLVFKESKILGKKISLYFEELNNYKNTLSDEAIYILKQFLTAEFLSPRQILKQLQDIDYLISYETIREKIVKNFLPYGLVKERAYRFEDNKFPRKRTKYYELTHAGLHCLLAKITEYDATNMKIFKLLKKDYFLNLFLFSLVNKGTLTKISSLVVLEIFIKYLRQIYKKINDELKKLTNIRKKRLFRRSIPEMALYSKE